MTNHLHSPRKNTRGLVGKKSPRCGEATKSTKITVDSTGFDVNEIVNIVQNPELNVSNLSDAVLSTSFSFGASEVLALIGSKHAKILGKSLRNCLAYLLSD